MKQRTLFFLVFLLCSTLVLISQERKESGNLVMEDIPEIPQRIIERMNQFQNVRAAGFLDWEPSGKGMLISTRFGETNQIHFLEQPKGARQQITFFKEPAGGGAFSPKKGTRQFVFSMDNGGGEFFQLYSFDMLTGKHQLLTDGKSRNTGFLWNNSGTMIAFSSTKRNGKDTDIYTMNPSDTASVQLVLEVTGSWGVLDWSPDDAKLIIQQEVSVTESYLFIADIAAGTKEQINPEQKIAYDAAQWSKDGKGIYYTSDENGEFQQLIYLETKTKKKTILTNELLWDIGSFQLSHNGKNLAFSVNEGGVSKLYEMNTATRKYSIIEGTPYGVIGGLGFSPDDSQIAMTINTPQTPGDVYTLQLSTKKFVLWTMSEVGGLNTDNFLKCDLMTYPTFDMENGKQRMIPAFIYKPKTNKEKKSPVIISIHGGPEGQSLPTFSPLAQYWAIELGCVVIFPNVRGSTGYGKSYVSLDNGFKREESVQDIGKLLDWIATQPDLDKERVAVYGGSYGGYMVLSSMFNFNERLRCGVDVVGISNFVTFLESTQEYRRNLRRVEYGDERDSAMRKFQMAISPTINAHKITKPLFVVQGLNDPRVPYTEAEQMVQTVRKNKNTVWYLLAKDEGHGFQKKSNRDYFTNAMTLFFEEYLLK